MGETIRTNQEDQDGDTVRLASLDSKELLVSDWWIVERLRRNAARECSLEGPAPFHLVSHNQDETLGHIIRLREKIPLIEFTRDFTETVRAMGVLEPALVSGIENDQLILEHEEIMTGYRGDMLSGVQPEHVLERERFLEGTSTDQIVGYVAPDIALWDATPDYAVYYRLSQNEQQIMIDPMNISIPPFGTEHLLRAYLLHCVDRQNVPNSQEKT